MQRTNSSSSLSSLKKIKKNNKTTDTIYTGIIPKINPHGVISKPVKKKTKLNL